MDLKNILNDKNEKVYKMEKLLNIKKYNIVTIKNAFFGLNDGIYISKINIYRGLTYLNVPGLEKNDSIWQKFIKCFLVQTAIKINDEFKDYLFYDFMTMMYLLSNNDVIPSFNDKDFKAKGLFRLFDQNNNGSLNNSEIQKMIEVVQQSILKCALLFNDQQINQIDQLQQNLIQNSDQICKIIKPQEQEIITEEQFIKRSLEMSSKTQFNILKTKGIRLMILNSL